MSIRPRLAIVSAGPRPDSIRRCGGARVSRAELARRLGCDEKEVRRMLDPKQHSTRLPKLQQALEALGKCLVYH